VGVVAVLGELALIVLGELLADVGGVAGSRAHRCALWLDGPTWDRAHAGSTDEPLAASWRRCTVTWSSLRSLMAQTSRRNQVDEREDHDPHDVDEVPVQPDEL